MQQAYIVPLDRKNGYIHVHVYVYSCVDVKILMVLLHSSILKLWLLCVYCQ